MDDLLLPTKFTIFGCQTLIYAIMKFSIEQKQKAEKFLSTVKCPICGSNHIQFTDEASHVIAFKGDDEKLDTSKVSWIAAFCGICKQCGYIMQFSVNDVLK